MVVDVEWSGGTTCIVTSVVAVALGSALTLARLRKQTRKRSRGEQPVQLQVDVDSWSDSLLGECKRDRRKLALRALGRRPGSRCVLLSLGASPFDSESQHGAYALDPAAPLNRQRILMIDSRGTQVIAVSTQGDVFVGNAKSIDVFQPFACLRALLSVRIQFVACGTVHCAAISTHNDLYTWGCNNAGQLGHGAEVQSESYPRRVGGLIHVRVKTVSCGPQHTLCTTCEDGQVFSWGLGEDGRLGHRVAAKVDEPKRILTFPVWADKSKGSSYRDFVQVACGKAHSIALDSEGNVFCFGEAQHGQCSVPKFYKENDRRFQCENFRAQDPAELLAQSVPVLCPQLVESLSSCKITSKERIVYVCAGKDFTMALSDFGMLYSWGFGPNGELGRNCPPLSPLPGRVVFITAKGLDDLSVVKVACGETHALALTSDGNVYGWGSNVYGEVGEQWKDEQAWKPRLVYVEEPSHEDLVRGAERRLDRFVDDPDPQVSLISCGRGFSLYARNLRVESSSRSGGVDDEKDQRQDCELQSSSKGRPRSPSVVKKLLARDEASRVLREKWEKKFIPQWKEANSQSKMLHGVPLFLRTTVWPLAIGNPLRITKPLYYAFKMRGREKMAVSFSEPVSCETATFGEEEHGYETPMDRFEAESHDMALGLNYSAIAKERETAVRLIESDLPRTFPSLGFFTPEGPFGVRLRNILNAFACYRPDVGYVQGMSYLAATICLNTTDEFVAFQCLANLLIREHLFAFFYLDRGHIFEYYEVFENALLENSGTREVAIQLSKQGVHPHLYAFNWFQTLFLKVLPLQTACRIIDAFLVRGTSFVVQAGVAIVYLFRNQLLNKPFEDCIKLLSCSPGQEVTWRSLIQEPTLFKTIESLKLSQRLHAKLSDLSASLFH